MQIRWTNIISLGVTAFAVTLALKLDPWLQAALSPNILQMPLRTTEQRLFILCVLGLLILGVVTVVKLIVQGRRDK